MKSVFEASNGIEAHMIKNLLGFNNIRGEVFGEHLQGGVVTYKLWVLLELWSLRKIIMKQKK